MRSVALARYRLLTGVRSADWILATAILVSAVPVALGANLTARGLSFLYGSEWPGLLGVVLRGAEVLFVISWILHWTLLGVSAYVLARAAIGPAEGVEASDLTAAVPISLGGRFWGNVLGILGCLAVLHICALPILVFAAVMSLVSTPMIGLYELITVMLMLFLSAAAVWDAGGPRTAFQWTRTLRMYGVAGLLLIGALYVTTRIAAFRDAFVVFGGEPSPRAWAALVASVDNPPLLVVLLILLLAGLIGFFYAQSIRPERRS